MIMCGFVPSHNLNVFLRDFINVESQQGGIRIHRRRIFDKRKSRFAKVNPYAIEGFAIGGCFVKRLMHDYESYIKITSTILFREICFAAIRALRELLKTEASVCRRLIETYLASSRFTLERNISCV